MIKRNDSRESTDYIVEVILLGKICDSMNKKYGTTLTTNRPYYPQLIWGSLDKYKKRLKRMKTFDEEYKKVEFEKVEIRKTKSNLPLNLLLK